MYSTFKKIVASGLAGLTLLLALSACSQSNGNSSENADNTDEKITLCESWNFDGGFCNLQCPLLCNGTYGIQNYISNFYETLVNYKNGEIVPGLAESWDVSDDGLTYTFYLKQGIKFSDGESFNAEATKTNLDNMPALLGDYNGVYGLTSTMIDEITVIDEYTVAVKLTSPYYGALQDFALTLPMSIMSPNGFNEDGSLAEITKTKTLGTGPYMYDGQKDNDTYTFIRNPYYDRGISDVEVFNIKVIPDNDAKLLALRSGEIDMLLGSANLTYDAFSELTNYSGFMTSTSTETVQSRYLGLNAAKAPFNDKAVREAIAYAINKDSISENIFHGVETAAESVLDKSLPYSNVETETYSYDPEQAIQILEDAGWKDSDGDGVREKNGVKLEVKIACGSDLAMLEDVTAAIAADLNKVGFNVTTESKETMSYYQDVYAGNFDMGLGYTYCIPMDPYQFVSTLSTKPLRDNMVAQGLTGVSDANILISSLYSMTDANQIQSVYNIILKELNDNAVLIPLTRIKGMAAFRTELISDYEFYNQPDYLDISSIKLNK